MTLPTIEPQYHEREIAHVDGIGKLIEKYWTVTAVRLVADPRTSVNGKILTLHPHEQKLINEAVRKICADRVRDIKAQQAALKGGDK